MRPLLSAVLLVQTLLLAVLLLDRLPEAHAADGPRYRLILVDHCEEAARMWCVRLEHKGNWEYAYDRETKKPLQYATQAEVLERYGKAGWEPVDFAWSSLITLRREQ